MGGTRKGWAVAARPEEEEVDKGEGERRCRGEWTGDSSPSLEEEEVLLLVLCCMSLCARGPRRRVEEEEEGRGGGVVLDARCEGAWNHPMSIQEGKDTREGVRGAVWVRAGVGGWVSGAVGRWDRGWVGGREGRRLQ